MKRSHVVSLAVVLGLILGGLALAQQMQSDIAAQRSCKYCGMDREKFDFSRMLIEYDDGTTAAFCSIHCAAVDLSTTIDKAPKAIKVGDHNTKDLIDAETAYWVAGGKKPGVMSKRGKWAFAKKEDAEAFLKANEGSLVAFEDAMKMAYEDMYEDTKAIRERRKMKRMKMMEQKS